MQIIDWPTLVAGEAAGGPVALTVGVFDSLHLGHRRLIRAVVENGWGASPALCTFRQNPAQVLGSRAVPGAILSLRQKVQRLEALGVALVILIDFSTEISKLTGKRFLELLTGRLAIRRMVVGYNFHMGQGRDTGVGELGAILSGSGTELEVVPAALYGGEVVSSSRIRACIRAGRFDEAGAMMGAGYALDLHDVGLEADAAGRAGSWRVPLARIAQVLPRVGAYSATCSDAGGERTVVVRVGESEIRVEGEPGPCCGELRFRQRLAGYEQPPAAGTPGE